MRRKSYLIGAENEQVRHSDHHQTAESYAATFDTNVLGVNEASFITGHILNVDGGHTAN